MEPELHPDLAHVAHLLGTWSGRGRGDYPTIGSFDYVETVTFTHVGKPFLCYTQRTRALLPDGSLGPPMHAESGYWRFPERGRVEVVLSHPTGVNEIEEGSIDVDDQGATTIRLETTSVALTASAKSVTGIHRTWRVHGDTIAYRVRMAAVGLPLQDHLEAELRRSLDATSL